MKHKIYTLWRNSKAHLLLLSASSIISFSAWSQCSPIPAGTYTVGPTGTYSTLRAAMDSVTSKGVTGDVIIELQSAYTSAGEVFPITIGNYTDNACSGSNPRLTIRPEAGATNPIVISGSNVPTLIDLNGAKYVTIDGRPGGIGTNMWLTIENTSLLTGNSTIRLINDACFNVLQYDSIKGANPFLPDDVTPGVRGGGTIYFAHTNGTRGNDSNTVDHCNIGDGVGLPTIGVFSMGTQTTTNHYNSNNVISNCNIYNAWSATLESSSFKIRGGNTDWTITGNSMYQTAPRTMTSAQQHYPFNMNTNGSSGSATGNNMTVTNNYIGGTAPLCGGTPWTVNSTVNARFTGMYLQVLGAVPSNVIGNTYANFNWTSATTNAPSISIWTGPILIAGNANFNNNTIGSRDSANSIVATSSSTGSSIVGIASTSSISSGTINVNNNYIGGLTSNGTTSSVSNGIVAIYVSGTNGTGTTININNNTVGNGLPDNIIAANNSTGAQSVYGIQNLSSARVNIRGNMIRNLANNSQSTGSAVVQGIVSTSGIDSITNDTIVNLSNAAPNSSTGVNASVVGINHTSTAAGAFIADNHIYNLINDSASAAAVSVTGINYTQATSGTNIVTRNFIRGLAAKTAGAAVLNGISVTGGNSNIQNNMIQLGFDTLGAQIDSGYVMMGINETGGTNNYYFNSVYIGGSSVLGSANTYGFFSSSTTTSARAIQNNIFYNARSNNGGTGKHYGIRLDNVTANTCNNNLYYVTGTGAMFGAIGATDYSSFSAWKTLTLADISSVFANPNFLNPTGTPLTCDLHIQSPTAIEGNGAPIAAVSDDYDGDVRSGLTPTDIGADAGNFIGSDMIAPAVSFTQLTNTFSTGDRMITATVTDATGISLSNNTPVIYFRKTGGSFVSSAGTYVSGTGQNSSWSFTIQSSLMGGINPGDSIYYFVVAQDSSINNNVGSLPAGVIATNVNSITTPPDILYGYKVLAAMSGIKTVGTSGADFPSLYAAFTEANTNGVNGNLTFQLLPNYLSSNETFPIVAGNIAGASASNLIKVYPTASGLKITGSNNTAIIDLNGAKYVTIDGRVNETGPSDLVIENTSTSGVAIRWINDACFNTIQYDTIKGVNTNSAGGVISFMGTNGTRGNDSNLVAHCDIRDGATTPATLVNAAGSTTSATHNNSNNTISNCNLYNFWLANGENNAFKIASGNTDWTITGNSVYQTAPRTATAALTQYMFNMNNTSAVNHVVTNNYFGGSAPMCAGTPWTVSGTVAVRFQGAYLNVGTAVPSTFSNNVYANFNWTTGTTANATIPGVWGGPQIVGGLVNMTDNTIGSMTDTSSIKVTSNVNGCNVFALSHTANNAGVVNIKRNKIGGINVTGNAAGVAIGVHGIAIASATSTVILNVDSNEIGNALADNIIAANATTSTTAQPVFGISNTSSATLNIRGNLIRNLRNNYAGTSTTPASVAQGISSTGGTDTIINNTIYNIANTGGAQNNADNNASVAGIVVTSSAAANLISRNTIYGLNQLYTGTNAVSVTGIHTTSGGANSMLSRNMIHSLNAQGSGTSGIITGINYSGGTTRVVNNMIRLGVDTIGNAVITTPATYGINKKGGNLVALFNTVYVGGSGVGTGTANTFAFNRAAVGVDSVLNNVLANERSNASTGGAHYAVGINNSTTLTQNSNLYWANGTGGALALYNTTPQLSMNAWNIASGIDGASAVSNPNFIAPNGTNATVDLRINAGMAAAVEGSGTPVAYVTEDFDGNARSGLTPTDIGANAGNFIMLDVFPPAINASALGNTPLLSDRIFTATLTDASGVPTGGQAPRVYFKKFSGGFYSSTSATLVSGTQQNGTWEFTISASALGGLLPADSVYYFIAAQDIISGSNLSSVPVGAVMTDVNTLTTPPPVVYSYRILPSIPSVMTVGGVSGTYTSLTGTGGVFETINAGALTGDLTIIVGGDLAETGANALNQWVEGGAGNYTVSIVPDNSVEYLISGAATNNLIRLNGADRVKIDGSFNGTGRYLRFRNTVQGGTTFQFMNDAKRDTIMNCFIEGINNTTGIILFGTSNVAGGTGNDSNGIYNNIIRDTLGTVSGNIPNTGISSSGTSGLENSENAIVGNEVFNFGYNGINLNSTGMGNNWVISNNSFYQTAPRVNNINVVIVAGGGGHLISNNNIGGSAADRSGTAFTTTTTSLWTGFNISAAAAPVTTISNNRVSNIGSLGTNAGFNAINITSGNIDVIGNVLGGGAMPYDTIRSNYDNGIINIGGGVTINLRNNTVGNVSYYAGGGDRTAGVTISAATVNMYGNTIRDIRANSSGTSTSYHTIGLWINAGVNHVIDSNTIYNIINTNTGTGANMANGICMISGNTSTISRNRIYNIGTMGTGTGSNAPQASGIYISHTNPLSVVNNQIAVGNNTSGETIMYGIQDVSGTGNTHNHLYNSIFVTGSISGGANNSYAFMRSSTTAVNLLNNILYNKRTGGTGSHYGAGLTNTGNITAANHNYNLFVVNDTARIVERPGGTANGVAAYNNVYTAAGTFAGNWYENVANIPANMLFTDTAVANLNPITTNDVSWYANGKGIAVAGFGGDFNTTGVRSVTIATGSTDIGSVEFATSTLPPLAAASAAPANSTVTNYTFGGRNIASISWGAAGTVPSSVDIRYYTGVDAPALLPSKTQFNAYYDMTAAGGSGYTYTATVSFDSAMFGNVSTIAGTRLASYQGATWLAHTSSSASAATGMITSPVMLTGSAVFTGTDASNPLPVDWLVFKGSVVSKDVWLNWSTASERNNKGFEVERSADGKLFEYVDFVKGNGNSSSVASYKYTDRTPFKGTNALYYRLKQVDKDGNSSYSQVIRVNLDTKAAAKEISAYPNPFVSELSIAIPSQSFETAVIRLVDIAGKEVLATTKEVTPGEDVVSLGSLSNLETGIYFLQVQVGGITYHTKLIKQ